MTIHVNSSYMKVGPTGKSSTGYAGTIIYNTCEVSLTRLVSHYDVLLCLLF